MNIEDAMDWKDAEIEIISGEETKTVPGVTFEWAPGLAITMAQFGYFNITHVNSKHRICAHTERFEQAILNLSHLAMIADSCGFSWSDGGKELGKQIIEAHGEKEVPFEGATDGTKKMTIRYWISLNSNPWPEFPWEEESPFDAAARNVELLIADTDTA